MKTTVANLISVSILVAVLMTIGCKGSPGGSPASTTLPPGWTRAEVPAEKISINLAPDWKQEDTHSQAYINGISANKTPEQKARAIRAATNPILKLMASENRRNPDEINPNMEVVVVPAPKGTLDGELKGALGVVYKHTTGKPSVTKTEFDGQDAYYIQWQRNNMMPSGPNTDSVTTYLFMKNGKLYDLSFSIVPGSGEQPTVDQMAKTFHVD